MKSYEDVIAYVAEAFLLPLKREEIEDNEIITILAFVYNKDELRILKDVKDYFRRRDA